MLGVQSRCPSFAPSLLVLYPFCTILTSAQAPVCWFWVQLAATTSSFKEPRCPPSSQDLGFLPQTRRAWPGMFLPQKESKLTPQGMAVLPSFLTPRNIWKCAS